MKENTTPTRRAGAAGRVGLSEKLPILPGACRSSGTPAQTAEGQIRAPAPCHSAGRRLPKSRLRRRFPFGRATVGAHVVPASPSICYHARTRDRPRPGTFILPIMGNTTLPLTSAGRGPLRNEPIMAIEPPVRPSPIHGALPSSPATSSPGGPRRAGLHRRASSAARAFLLPPITKRTHFRRLPAGCVPGEQAATPLFCETNPFSCDRRFAPPPRRGYNTRRR